MGWTQTDRVDWFYDIDRGLVSEKPEFPEGLYTNTMTPHQRQSLESWCDTRGVPYPSTEETK